MKAFFTKTGIKLIFNKNDILTPYSNIDIKDDNQSANEQLDNISYISKSSISELDIKFLNNFTELIIKYPECKIWFLKMDYEYTSRGLAYIKLDELHEYHIIKNHYIQNSSNIEQYKKSIYNLLKENLYNNKNINNRFAVVIRSTLYKTWNDYIINFIKYGGIIEACPTQNISQILSTTCIPIFLQPDGNVEIYNYYDKINSNLFINLGAILPSKILYLNNKELINNINDDISKICSYLYERDVFGYMTLQILILPDENEFHKYIYTAIDIKFGLDDIFSSFNFCNTIYHLSSNSLLSNNKDEDVESDISIYNNYNNFHCFSLPYIFHPNFKHLMISDLVNSFRDSSIIYSQDIKTGVLFNLCDVLEAGCFGICGIINNDEQDNKNNNIVWKYILNCFKIISLAIDTKYDYFSSLYKDVRTDGIPFKDIYKKLIKEANIHIK